MIKDVKNMLQLNEDEYANEQRVIVALEKKHSDEIVVTYYIQTSRKNLYLYSINNGKVVKEKKDPYGITVTEVFHINKLMNENYQLKMSQIKTVKKLLKERFIRDTKKLKEI